MCVYIDLSSLPNDVCSDAESRSAPISSAKEVQKQLLLADDLKAALVRRGPDHLGSRTVSLKLKMPHFVEKENDVPYSNEESFLPNGSNSCCQLSHSSSDEYRFEEPSPNCLVVELDIMEDREKRIQCLCCPVERNNYINSAFEVDCAEDLYGISTDSAAELHLIGATLQLRGTIPVHQPLEDASGNLLIYNGINVESDRNDGETLMHLLGSRCYGNFPEFGNSCYCIENGQTSVPMLLSKIKGPWSLIYWQARSKTIWFGRDAFGRRSLLVHWPTSDDPRFLLSSVSCMGSTATCDNFELKADSEAAEGTSALDYWRELPCGIYSIHLDAAKAISLSIVHNVVGQVRQHEWTDQLLKGLIKWERCSLEHKSEDFIGSSKNAIIPPEMFFTNKGSIRYPVPLPAQKVLVALRESVMRRTTENKICQANLHKTREGNLVPVAVLFSGGLDSIILAALLDQCLDSTYEIDLLNVSFAGQLAPDRITAQVGIRELQRVAPSRRWRLVEIDADLSSLISETKHVTTLIYPARTYMNGKFVPSGHLPWAIPLGMQSTSDIADTFGNTFVYDLWMAKDLNIGMALWLAAGGDGWVDEEICNHHQKDIRRHKYKSEAKILLVGAGADEQCAGYSRHRTKYRLGGWVALEEEMKLDMQRIWKRNLGRDDRCISDNGKEARFPFLDEDVIRTLLEIPLPDIAELDQPLGKGDKKILREVSQLLGLGEAAVLPKRAIQFGSRIARESNRKNFGSNRAANQASAGSVVIKK
ncbi:hypothetical protein ACLOJK_035630 [Asimina triloba]